MEGPNGELPPGFDRDTFHSSYFNLEPHQRARRRLALDSRPQGFRHTVAVPSGHVHAVSRTQDIASDIRVSDPDGQLQNVRLEVSHRVVSWPLYRTATGWACPYTTGPTCGLFMAALNATHVELRWDGSGRNVSVSYDCWLVRYRDGLPARGTTTMHRHAFGLPKILKLTYGEGQIKGGEEPVPLTKSAAGRRAARQGGR